MNPNTTLSLVPRACSQSFHPACISLPTSDLRWVGWSTSLFSQNAFPSCCLTEHNTTCCDGIVNLPCLYTLDVCTHMHSPHSHLHTLTPAHTHTPLLVDFVGLGELQDVLHNVGVQALRRDSEVPVSQLRTAISELYTSLRVTHPILNASQLQEAQEHCLNWLMMAFQWYIPAHMHTSYIYTNSYIHTYIHTYVHTYMYIRTYIHDVLVERHVAVVYVMIYQLLDFTRQENFDDNISISLC